MFRLRSILVYLESGFVITLSVGSSSMTNMRVLLRILCPLLGLYE